MNRKKGFFILVAVLAAALLLPGYTVYTGEYADAAHWAWLETEPSKDADLFFLTPTVYSGDEESFNMALDDEKSMARFLGAANMERGIYEQSLNLFAPYYRQASLSAYKLPQAEREEYMELAYKDVRNAFLYYMKEYNGGRPVVLAGFFQGADMALRLLEEFYGKDTYQNKLVAAYIIGGAVTPQTLETYPHLRMAQCECDVGCIVSFTSEAESASSSVVVPDTTVGINPLNWKTDATPADAKENPGACFTDYDGEIKEEIPALCGAYLDPARGTLKVTGITPEDYPPVLDIFESGNYNIYDYQFFYRSLQANVTLRVKQYLTLDFLHENYETLDETAEDSAPAATAAPYLSVAANVTPAMLSADYWTAKIAEPDAVFMTEQEIEAYNALAKGAYYDYCEDNSPKSLSADTLKSFLTSLGQPGWDCWLDGVKLEQDYWDKLYGLRGIDAVQAQNPIAFGICVSRGDLRLLPTDDIVSASEKFTFYDELQNSTTLYNEPVIVLHTGGGGDWYFVLTRYCSGWIHKEDVAICESFEQWHSAQSFKDFLVVTDDKLRTELDPVDAHSSELELSMGVRLELIPAQSFKSSAEGRYAYDCYTVALPYRDENGSYAVTKAFIPVSADVHVGYLDYTPANVLTLAFNSDGGRYGWGGMYNARDCSQLAMELYRCFGLVLERNSSAQASMPCHTVELDGMSDAMKRETLAAVPAGSILHFPGHIMLYLGQEDDRCYVLSSTGSMIPADSADGAVLTVESVMVNDLSVVRRNGKTWLQSMTCAKILWEAAA